MSKLSGIPNSGFQHKFKWYSGLKLSGILVGVTP